ncbi:MAG: protein kinase [Gammaproteobacteria bacterium]|nr:protein kinase [Gammaproteobacteria bacterium]
MAMTSEPSDSDKTSVRPPRPEETAVRARPGDPTRMRAPPGDDPTRMRPERASVTGAARSTPEQRPTSQTAFGQGYRLRGRYLLDRLIGQGAMGQVWRAKDLLGEEARDRNPYVAVKVLNSNLEGHPEAFVAMHREATRAQKLAHPNIVTVHVFDRDDELGRAFIAMELLEGRPLDQVIREAAAGGLPREQAMPLIRGMAQGLAYAHSKGIVHSDFKPANVFVSPDGTPKILDFGIARAVQVAGMEPTDSGDHDGFQGYTPSYAAPEALDGEPPSTSEDVFSLGLVAYELVMGGHPFNRMSAHEARSTRFERAPLQGLKRRECNAIERALAFDRSQRFPDAGAFLRQLQGVPFIQKALVAVVCVLVLAAAGLWYSGYRESLPKEPLEQLPVQVQRDFADKVRQGNESLDYLKRTHDVTASADAAQYFGEAYRLHAKDPQAVSGLRAAADYAIDWYGKFPDRTEARTQLERFAAKSDYYDRYEPLQKAIRAAAGK